MPTAGSASSETPPDAPDTPVDLGPLPGLIGYRIRRAQLAVFQDFNRRFASFDIRPADYSVLLVIAHNPGLKQSAVGEALGIKRSNLVALIDGLRRRGWIRRRAVAGDRRAYALSLTSEGTAALARLDAIRKQHEALLVEKIGADRAPRLLEMLHHLAALDEPGSASDPEKNRR